MRINKYIAAATGLSRRAADAAISNGRVTVNGLQPTSGQQIAPKDVVTLDGSPVTPPTKTITIVLNKPVGYVCSRAGQGSATIYELLPTEYAALKPVGRLDKDSSGLLVLTNDGALAQTLAHPSYQKQKVYQAQLDKPLELEDEYKLAGGVTIDDYTSHVAAAPASNDRTAWTITMTMGKNRQIRRTFEALGYTVTKLHRTAFGEYSLGRQTPGTYILLP